MANGTIAASQLEMESLSGTGIITVTPPATNTNRAITLPDAAGQVVLDSATQTLTNKSIAATQLTGNVAAARITDALNAGGSAPIYACRAWVNFDGTTSPGTIRASGNVSSVTRNATGDYTVNFTTAMPDTNYSVVASCDTFTASNAPTVLNTLNGGTYSTSAVRVITTYAFNTSYQNVPKANISIFR